METPKARELIVAQKTRPRMGISLGLKLDPEFRTAEETEVDALAEEMEPHETNE
jgi:hypothetical protein